MRWIFLLATASVVNAFLSSSSHSRRSHDGHSCRRYSSTKEVLDKPKWAGGGDLVSDLVNGLISIKPLFNVMKVQARKTLIGTAEKNGIPWSERSAVLGRLVGSTLQSNYDDIESKPVVNAGYPSYYTQEFHAYDDGNLNWQAATECESATMSMALRVWPKDGLTAEAAQDRLRYSFMDAVENYANETRRNAGTSAPLSGLAALQSLFSGAKSSSAAGTGPTKIIDIGCSVGMSTFYLAERFPQAKVIDALDLSPHFLAVGMQRQARAMSTDTQSESGLESGVGVFKGLERFATANLNRIRWIHANIEGTDLPANTYDLTAASFMFHELPQEPSETILREMYRITKPEGVVAITDNNPKSAVIQGLPPALFTLMKSTEPWSDEYYTFDLEDALRKVGFTDVMTVATDPRHRTVLGKKNAL